MTDIQSGTPAPTAGQERPTETKPRARSVRRAPLKIMPVLIIVMMAAIGLVMVLVDIFGWVAVAVTAAILAVIPLVARGALWGAVLAIAGIRTLLGRRRGSSSGSSSGSGSGRKGSGSGSGGKGSGLLSGLLPRFGRGSGSGRKGSGFGGKGSGSGSGRKGSGLLSGLLPKFGRGSGSGSGSGRKGSGSGSGSGGKGSGSGSGRKGSGRWGPWWGKAWDEITDTWDEITDSDSKGSGSDKKKKDEGGDSGKRPSDGPADVQAGREVPDSESSLLAWGKALGHTGPACNEMASHFSELARQATNEQPAGDKLATRLNDLARTMREIAGRADDIPDLFDREHAEDRERFENPRGGSHSVERRADVSSTERDT